MIARLIRPLAFAALALAAGCATPVFAPDDPGERLMNDVRALSSDRYQGRATGTVGGALAQAWVQRRMEQAGLQPGPQGWRQTFITRDRANTEVTGINLVGVLPGSGGPDAPWIVLSAHYDHVGVRNGQIYNGADDNASGVAATLELTRRFRERPLRHNLMVLFPDAEELGLRGARHFVANAPVPVENMALNVNLDMVARGDNGIYWVVGTYQWPVLRPVIEALPVNAPVTIRFGHDTPQDTGANDWINRADQAAFLDAGVPSLFFSVDDHMDYHQPADDPEKIPVDFFVEGVRITEATIRALDADPALLARARAERRR
ncbi:M20/M25/M40 family metallo-hydrolase [Brevundimonas sp. 2R-24]|uniref:M20/M25/M40 family metallo-hydrolase n=1 Tax=Peiella sedimenti TaxID=3061083 RepID=A0ABT8SLP1_9CAUL|nr:M20/M25/M40 family metallo-hydrolase [Caulobacteraceae bacterium XZ-24]